MSRSWFHGQRCACVPQRGGGNRAAASGRLRTDRARGRLRTDRAGGCGRTGPAHAQTNIQNNSFILPFISIHLLNNFLMLRSPAFFSQFSCKSLVKITFSTTIPSVHFICKSIPL